MSTDPVYLFVHLFKTGGTTINGHLAHHLTWDEEFVHLGPWGDRVRARDGRPDPAEWSPEHWERARVIAGHRVGADTLHYVEGRDVRFLTILRDPAELMVSRHNFRASRLQSGLNFWDWYAEQPPNPATRRLRKALGAASPAALRRTLRDFWFVGVTDHLDDDLPHLFTAMGVPKEWVNRRVTGGDDDLGDLDMGRETFAVTRHTTLTEEMRERIHADHPKDVRLFRFGAERRAEVREAFGWQ